MERCVLQDVEKERRKLEGENKVARETIEEVTRHKQDVDNNLRRCVLSYLHPYHHRHSSSSPSSSSSSPSSSSPLLAARIRNCTQWVHVWKTNSRAFPSCSAQSRRSNRAIRCGSMYNHCNFIYPPSSSSSSSSSPSSSFSSVESPYLPL